MKMYLLPPPTAGAQRENEVLLLQYNSFGVHGNGGSGGLEVPDPTVIDALDGIEG